MKYVSEAKRARNRLAATDGTLYTSFLATLDGGV